MRRQPRRSTLLPDATLSPSCASSLQSLRMAFHAIVAGEGDQYVAAGVEAVSRFPHHPPFDPHSRSEEHTSELQSRQSVVCRLLVEKNKKSRIGTYLAKLRFA